MGRYILIPRSERVGPWIYSSLLANRLSGSDVVISKTIHKGSVANVSPGGGKSDSLDRAVTKAVESESHYTVPPGMSFRQPSEPELGTDCLFGWE
jgi:hypothetical protein